LLALLVQAARLWLVLHLEHMEILEQMGAVRHLIR
jgi:hypothetical protein